MFNEELKVDVLLLDDLVALRVMDVHSKYPLPKPERLGNPQEVWRAFSAAWIGVLGQPKGSPLNEGGE